MIYDSIVIGRGMIGSAAAKYLSQSKQNVLLIGPDEERSEKEGIVFSSHYDQSRVQRIIGKDETWTLLNQQSANEYDSLENEAGIQFHSNVGCLYVNPYGSDAYLDNISKLAKKFNQNHQLFQNGASIHSFFPDFNFPPASEGMFEPSPSGFINPRLLIKAQLKMFEKNAAEILSDTINGISYENDEIKITTITGKIFYSKKVLLATGAFINFFNLLERKLDLKLKSETNILAKVSAAEAHRLAKLPSLLYEIMEPEIQNIYLVHPLQYPDGNYYIKMGANLPEDVFFNSLKETQDWFKSEINSAVLQTMQSALLRIISTLSLEECFLKKCIVAFTKHGKPYIGATGKGLYFAAGGNGYSAMCSDALGKIAATLLLENQFPKGFSQKNFEPVFAE
jgi:sarcosine oxidase